MEAVFSTTNELAHIRQALGPPTAQAVYLKPTQAGDIPELAGKLRFQPELSPEALLTGHEDYKYRGRVYAPDGVGLAYMNQYLPVIGEVVMFPCAVWVAVKEGRQVHRFRVWYAADDSYFAHIQLRAD